MMEEILLYSTEQCIFYKTHRPYILPKKNILQVINNSNRHFESKRKRNQSPYFHFRYTTTKGFEGPVFGSSDRWNGLGIFFDSFDNDNKHNNPYIMGMVNDGQKVYDHQKDGSTQQLAGCLRDFRNKPFPVRAKIEFYKNTLQVMFHNGMSNNEKEYEMCMRVENVVLPKSGYFGISAATGGLADDHDVMRFSVSSLRSPETANVPDLVDPESQKFEEEFEQYQQKLKEQKDQWAKENPEEVSSDHDNQDGDRDPNFKQFLPFRSGSYSF